jgi:aspartate racemase
MRNAINSLKRSQRVGVIGGLGPLATVKFQEIFFENFRNQCGTTSDQDFPELVVIHDCKTPDRTAYILDKTKPDPTPHLQKSLSELERLGCDLIVIPCNTAHYFIGRLQKNKDTEIVNIIEQAA